MEWGIGGERIFVGTSSSDETGGMIRAYNVADVCFFILKQREKACFLN